MAETPKQPSLISKRLAEQYKSPNKVQQDVISGAQFGEAVIGEGLGRLGGETIEGIQAKLAERAKGFTSQEETARREQALGTMGAQSEAQRRALQASLARSGVKGGAAAQAQLAQAAQAGQQRANFERDFILQQRAAEGQALQQQAEFESGLQQFNLGQAAKEKNIALQTGLGFAGIGAQERGAKLAANAAAAAAQAQQGGSSGGLIGGVVGGVKKIFCHEENTEVLMKDGSFKKIGNLKLGDELELGGRVTMKADMINQYDTYIYNGEIITGSHYILENMQWIMVKDSENAIYNGNIDCIICPIETENGVYATKGGYISGDFSMEYEDLMEEHNGEKYKEMVG